MLSVFHAVRLPDLGGVLVTVKDVVLERVRFGLLKVQNFSFLTAAASDSLLSSDT
jgi:hypothetical protein